MDAKKQGAGTLYIVATPIGNSRDMSARGIEILTGADILAAEDTRRSMVLLNKLGIRNKLVSNHKFNERGRAGYFIRELLDGKSVAVITDAGTPCISDPGNELVRAAVEAGVPVVGVPGACAAVTALSISGFDLRTFVFGGFFPRENADRRRALENMRRGQARTWVFYESPRRIMDMMEFFLAEDVRAELCVCNDLTKLYETTFRGAPAEVRNALLAKGNYEKGEFCVVLELAEEELRPRREHIVTPEALLTDRMVRDGCGLKDAIRLALADGSCTYTKNELYAASLRLKALFS